MVLVMPVIRVIPAEHPDGTSGGASSGSGMGVPVVLVGVGCLANLAAVSQWYQCGDPNREIPVLPVVSTCPLKVRVMQGWIRVKELLMTGICKCVWVGFI